MKEYSFENAQTLIAAGSRESPAGGGEQRGETLDLGLLSRLTSLGDQLEPELAVLREADPALYNRALRALKRVHGSMGISALHDRISRLALPPEVLRRVRGQEEEAYEAHQRQNTPTAQRRETAPAEPDPLDTLQQDMARDEREGELRDAQETGEQRLDEETQRLAREASGVDLSDVRVRVNDREADARGVLGVAERELIRLSSQTPGPDTEAGREVRLHEAGHILQFRLGGQGGGRDMAPGGGSDGAMGAWQRAEVEASQFAQAALSGARYEIRTTVQAASALNFTEITDDMQRVWDEASTEATAPVPALSPEPLGDGTALDAKGAEGGGDATGGGGAASAEGAAEVEGPQPEEEAAGASEREMAAERAEGEAAIDAAARERPVNVPPETQKRDAGTQGAQDGTQGDPAKDQQELDKAQREIQQTINSTFGRGIPVETGQPPTMTVDMGPAEQARQRFEQDAERRKEDARQQTQENFGEQGLEPTKDPFEGIDPELEGIEPAEVDVASMLDEDKVNRVLKDDNVGTPLTEVILVEPEELDKLLAGPEMKAPGDERAKIGEARQEASEEILQSRRDSNSERQSLIDGVSQEIDAQREAWRAEQDKTLGEQRAEVGRLIERKSGEAQAKARRAQQGASDVLAKAERDAKAQERRARQRAEEKRQEAKGGSWLSRGWSWIRSKVSAVRDSITNLYRQARDAVRGLVERAKRAAMRLIDDAKEFVRSCLSFIERHLDQLIAALPGVLREIATKYRDEIHGVLRSAQENLDAWAEALKQTLSGLIDGLVSLVGTLLDGLEAAITLGVEALEALMDGNFDAWLRARFPKLAQLLDEGLEGLMERAGEEVSGALESMVEGLGLDKVAEAFSVLSDHTADGHTVFEGVLDGCCECFKKALGAASKAFQGLLGSPIAQALQGALASFNESSSDLTLDMATGLFGLLQTIGGPVYEFILGAAEMGSSLISKLGEIGQSAWRHFATAVGLDPNVGPLEALKKGLESLWESVSSALEPLQEAITQAWDWLKNDSPLQPLFEFFNKLGEIAGAVQELVSAIMADPSAWIASAAEALKNTILQPVIDGFGTLAGIAAAAGAALGQWLGGLLEQLGALSAFQAAAGFLQGLVAAVQRLVQQATGELEKLREQAVTWFTALAKGARDMVATLQPIMRTVMELLGVLSMTMSGNIFAIPAYLYRVALPECYKEPLIDFLLDTFIALVEWFPPPGDMNILGGALRAGMLGFLQELRAADADAKVKAMDTVARLLSGDPEFMLGFVIGLGKGVYEATVGTVVFIFEAAAWLFKVGMKLVSVPLGLLFGGEEEAEGDEGSDSTESLLEEAREGANEEEEEAVPEVEAQVEMDEDEVDGDAPDEDAEPEGGGEEVESEEEAEEGEGDDREQEREDDEGAAAASGDEGAAAGDEGPGVEPEGPPAMPEGLNGGKALFDKIFREGVTREEIETFITSLGGSLETAAGQAGREGARKLIEALNASGTLRAVGEAIGTVVGMLAVEIVLAALTGGGALAKTVVSAGSKALKAITKLVPMLARLLPKLKKALQPVFQVFQKLKSAFGQFMTKLQKYLDDLMAWAKRSLQRLRRGRRRPRRPRGRKPRGRRRKPRDRSGARTLAVMAARRGWRSAQRVTTQRVQKEGKVKSTLRAVRVRARPGTVRLALVRRRSGWKVKATARKGARRATARVGRGWIAKDTKRKNWFAARSMVAFNRQLAERTEQELERWGQERDNSSNDSRLRSQLERAEKRGDSQLQQRLQGVDMKLEVKRGRSNDEKTVVKGTIEPNYYIWEFQINGTGLQEVREAIERKPVKTDRYNRQLAFLRGLARDHNAQVNFEEAKEWDRATRQTVYFVRVIYRRNSETLEVRLTRQSEVADRGTLSDRPFLQDADGNNLNASRPHDAIPGSTLANAFDAVAARQMPPIPNNDRLLREFRGRVKSTSGPAVGDGQSHRDVENHHGSYSADQRRQISHSQHVSGNQLVTLSTGSLSARDFHGEDWDTMSPQQVLDAMEARLMIIVSDCRKMASFGKLLAHRQSTPEWQSVNLDAFLAAFSIEAMQAARQAPHP